MVEPVKGTDVANMRTEATYGTELNEYQMPYHMTSPPYQSYPPLGYCYSGYETNQNPNYQLPYEMSREQMLMECHDLFLKWMSKLNVLMQYWERIFAFFHPTIFIFNHFYYYFNFTVIARLRWSKLKGLLARKKNRGGLEIKQQKLFSFFGFNIYKLNSI